MLPGSLEALRLLSEAGYRVLVLTNQACVGRGEVSMKTLEAIHNRLRQETATAGGKIDGFFICTHVPSDKCYCRKPKPGLIIQAQQKWGFDPTLTYFVGDDRRDMEAAMAANCKPVLVLTGKGRVTRKFLPTIPVFADLLAFVKTITKLF